ncbi:MAG TPA: transcriptional repressor LexA [bacterium]|nr:transcriptional repressor LexA [bacterium]
MTKRQKEILDFIKSYSKKNGFSPTQEEITKRFRRSLSTIHGHLKNLQEAGEIRLNKNQRRGIEILGSTPMVQVSLLGSITAGQPLTLFDVPSETIAVPKNKVPSSSEIYALRVIGDSMIDEGIKDGDIILVKHQSTAENGQKVVALIDNYDTTLKTFYKERNKIRLQPANKNYEPIIVKKDREFAIQGIVLDVIKNSQEDIELNLPVKTQEKRTKTNNGPTRKPYYEKPKFKLYQADCLDVLASFSENSVDMIFADPPYNLSNGGFTVHAGRMVSVNKGNWDKSRGFEDDYNFHYKCLWKLLILCMVLRRIMKRESRRVGMMSGFLNWA